MKKLFLGLFILSSSQLLFASNEIKPTFYKCSAEKRTINGSIDCGKAKTYNGGRVGFMEQIVFPNCELDVKVSHYKGTGYDYFSVMIGSIPEGQKDTPIFDKLRGVITYKMQKNLYPLDSWYRFASGNKYFDPVDEYSLKCDVL